MPLAELAEQAKPPVIMEALLEDVGAHFFKGALLETLESRQVARVMQGVLGETLAQDFPASSRTLVKEALLEVLLDLALPVVLTVAAF